MAGSSGTPGLLRAAGNYFATPDGQAVYLAGDHTWTNSVSYSNYGQFDFGAYLNVLQSQGSNLTRYWANASSQTTHNNAGTANPMPFLRSGSGTAADGGSKFDLTKFNQAYFDHIRSDVQAAAAKGVYVSIMLFFDNDPNSIYDLWRTDVWNGNNNVNRTTTSNATVQQGTDATTLALQKAYVAKVLDTVRDLPNVLFEVANEAAADPATNAWQNTIIDFVHSYEASHGYLAHPVGMTATWPVSNWGSIDTALNASHADWISPNGNGSYQSNPPDATGNKVQLVDTDHIFGMGGDANWVWQQFARGQNVLVMDDMSGTGLPGTLNVGLNGSQIATEINERLGIAETRQAAQLVNLTRMTPADSLASTGFALADTSGAQYIVYAPSGGQLSVNLSAAAGRTLDVHWMNVGSGQMTSAGTIQGGSAAQGFNAPFGGGAALVLTPDAAAATSPAPTGTTPPGTPQPSATQSVTIGSGPDSLVLNLAEDAWQGDAQFTVTLDGRQIGGTQTTTALQNSGQSQAFTFNGTFGSGPHTVGVTFLNDAWGGTPSTDRNLYVNSVSLDGQASPGTPAALMSQGTSNFAVPAAPVPVSPPTPATPTTTGSGPDSLVLNLAEDAWQGDAQFAVSVDGKQIASGQAVTASNAAGSAQSFTYNGTFGSGPHTVGVSFLNDAWGGTPSTDRNLYVKSVSLDGQASPGAPAALMSQGTSNFAVPATQQDDSLVLHLSEDAWQGDAQFLVSVDGKQIGGAQSVTASHAAGASQSFAFHDGLGAGPHTLSVSFLNDAWGGSAGADRNLYVDSVDYHGAHYASASAPLWWTGTTQFSVGLPLQAS